MLTEDQIAMKAGLLAHMKEVREWDGVHPLVVVIEELMRAEIDRSPLAGPSMALFMAGVEWARKQAGFDKTDSTVH